MTSLRWDYATYRVGQQCDSILGHPIVLAQQGHKQLGQLAAVYPGATHTRFDHAGFAAHIADLICETLERNGRPNSRADIVAFAKLHDVGHPPFSHAVEYLLRDKTGVDHKQRLLQLLDSDIRDGFGRTLADVLHDTGADIDSIRKMVRGESMLASICTDKSFGADKLAYTLMDASRTDFNQLPPDWHNLIPFMTFYERGFGIDVKKRPHDRDTTARTVVPHDNPIGLVTAMQHFHFRMYAEVYLSPQSLALERHIQKAVEYGIDGGLLVPDDIWSLPDDALVHTIATNDGSNDFRRKAKKALEGYMTRRHFVSAVALKYENSFLMDNLPGERNVTIEPEFGMAFTRAFANPTNLTRLEDSLTEELKVPVLVSVLPDPEKVQPTDVLLYANGNSNSLRNVRGDHYRMLEELARVFFAIRLLTHEEHQARIAQDYKDISVLMKEKAQAFF